MTFRSICLIKEQTLRSRSPATLVYENGYVVKMKPFGDELFVCVCVCVCVCVLKSSSQDKGGEGAKELEDFHSDHMKVVQLDVCSDEEVSKAVKYIRDNLGGSERGKYRCDASEPR